MARRGKPSSADVTDWHRLFGIVLTELFEGSDWEVVREQDLSVKQHLAVLDVESAILTGEIDKVLTFDPRGTRFVVINTATDETMPVAVVVRFFDQDRLLIITVYEI